MELEGTALFYRERKKLDTAEKLYLRALSIWEKANSGSAASNDSLLSTKFKSLAQFYREQGKKAEAEALDKRAKEILAKALGSIGSSSNPETIDTLLSESGVGYTTYNREPGGADQYGRTSTIRAILELGVAWASKYPKVPFAVGDISQKGGGPFPPHGGHRDGRQVDIRPLTKDGVNEPTNIGALNYSSELTRELILMIKQMFPGATISFNDPQLVNEGLTKRAQGYGNHLHVQFP